MSLQSLDSAFTLMLLTSSVTLLSALVPTLRLIDATLLLCYLRQIIIQTNTYGNLNSLLQVTNTSAKIWRQVRRSITELTNQKSHVLVCSHYIPDTPSENNGLPCVIYCHGNSGCRADANEAAVILLPLNITVFTIDLSGSGLSGGDFVSLGWNEKDDLRTVVSFLRDKKMVSSIGLWGRSMGAVTSLLYGAEDPSISGMVLDSAFSNLYNLMVELSDVYKFKLPKFTVKFAVQYMRRVILRKAKFDIMDLDVVQFASKTFIPALFGHASEDIFVHPHHSELIYQSYAGEKIIIKFDGDHNTPRPQSYYDSVALFFCNTLQPPQSTWCSRDFDKHCDLGHLGFGSDPNESSIEIISRLRAVGNDSASSSSNAPSVPKGELLSESIAKMSIKDDMDFLLEQSNGVDEVDPNGGIKHSLVQDKSNEPDQRFQPSSLDDASLGSHSMECTKNCRHRHRIRLRPFGIPLRRIKRKLPPKSKEEKSNASRLKKKPKCWGKLERAEALLSLALRLCVLRRPNHKRSIST
ncbi:hypothetical protein HPP92_021919 [Vanilla planifolia]|uniref:Serine aminopeptidase S33 domain-containing protein n=1 Tax=Vanilla planifolia TaxID=51239 RepID=A0A835Q5A7_VANPL|nr:hypothetical protein HPP92_021919 [Vanilla planifolia]